MKVIIVGASGMVGKSVLLECLEHADTAAVLAIGRSSCGVTHPKLKELVHPDLFDLGPVSGELAGYDACFYCLGVSAAGKTEEAYRRITVDLTMAIIEPIVAANPAICICFVSGQGTDSSGTSRVMWARVKGEAENALLAMRIDAYMFRPGFIQPLKGVRSKTFAYRILYALAGPLIPLLRRVFPGSMTTSVEVARAMIVAVRLGYHKRTLETADINALAARWGASGKAT